MPIGTVVRFDRRRGYGFITPDEGGEDVFVHQNNIQMEGFRYLQVGEKVNFDLEVGEKGMKAVSVSLTEPRVERPRDSEGGYGEQDERDNPRPRFNNPAPRPAYGDRGADRPAFDRPARAAGGGDDVAKLRRKLERMISLLVEKGVVAPGEIDAVAEAAASAQG